MDRIYNSAGTLLNTYTKGSNSYGSGSTARGSDWGTTSDYTGYYYSDCTTISSVSASGTVCRNFYPNSYTVSYDVNGGTGTISDTSRFYNEAYILTSMVPTKKLYRFVGWATSANGTTTYPSGGSMTASTSTSKITYYAIWEKIGSVYYGLNGQWVSVQTYIGVNNVWVPMQFMVGANNQWIPIGGGSEDIIYPEGAFIPVTQFTNGKRYALVAVIDGVRRFINTTTYNNYTMNATQITLQENTEDYVTFSTTPALFTAVASGSGFLLQNGNNYLHGTTSNGTALRVGTTQAVWTIDTSSTGGFASGKYLTKEDPNAVWLFNNSGGYNWSIKYETAGSFGYDREGRDNTYSTGFVSFILYEYVEK